MRIRVRSDLASGLFFFTLSIVIFKVIPSQTVVQGNHSITPRTFPYLVAGLMMLMSLQLVVRDVVRLILKKEAPICEFDLQMEAKALLLFGILIAYTFLMKFTGFLPASLAMVLAFMLYFRVRDYKYYIIVTGICLAVFIAFRYGLKVKLP